MPMFLCCCGDETEKLVEREPLAIPDPSPLPAVVPALPCLEEEDGAEESSESYYDVEASKEGFLDWGLGLAQNASGDGLYITGIEAGGPFCKYNSSPFSSRQVRPSDLIVEVSGERRSEAMLHAMRMERELKFKMFRPVPVKIKLNRAGRKPLGLKLCMKGGDGVLSVAAFDGGPGAVKEYNAGAPAGLQVRVHDYVASINGVSGSKKEMLLEMLRAEDLEIVLVRGPRKADQASDDGLSVPHAE